MTIEDYELILLVEKGISDTAINKIGNSDEKAARFYEGQIWGLKFALDLLKKVGHDVTLKELHQYCDKHREENGHHGCPFLVEGNPDAEEREDRCPHCRFDNEYPRDWDVDAIQKHMKEAQQ